MEKQDAITDSEDEAFESADEGDDPRSDGPSLTVAGIGSNVGDGDGNEPNSTKMEEGHSQDKSRERLEDSGPGLAEVSIEGSGDAVEVGVSGEEKDGHHQGDENAKGGGDEILTQAKNEEEQGTGKGSDASEENCKNLNDENVESAKTEEKDDNNDDKQEEEEENSTNKGLQNEPNGTDSKEANGSNDGKEEVEDDSLTKEPSIEPIHEANKDEAGGETSLPIAQAMDRLAGSSDKKR